MGKSACITLASHVLILTWVCTYFNLQTHKIYTSEYVLYVFTNNTSFQYVLQLTIYVAINLALNPQTEKSDKNYTVMCENAFIIKLNLRTKTANNELNCHSLTTHIILN